MSSTGKVIVLAGVDWVGKKPQTDLLVNYLKSQGKDVIVQAFPNESSPSSAPAKMYLNGELTQKDEEIDAYQSSVLFAVDRFCTVKKLLKDSKPNTFIVFTSYVEGNMIFQGGKLKDEKAFDEYADWLDNLEYGKMKLPRPDATIYLDMSEKNYNERITVSLKDKKEKDIQDDKEAMLKYFRLGKKISKKYNFSVISYDNKNGGEKTDKEVHEDIVNELKKLKIL